jgi:hypothetical protein
MAENYGNLIMVTRVVGVQGFPSILNEMLRRGNFSYLPEYSVYARGLELGLVDYFATMFIPMRLVEGVNHSHNFVSHGTSVGMAIQPPRNWRIMDATISTLPNTRTTTGCECG